MDLPRQRCWFEWPTFALFAFTYLGFAIVTISASYLPGYLVIALLSILLALHSSLQHETIHILEPRWPILSFVLAAPALGLAIPYCRFRDMHLAHHINEQLTDPFDDPESGYLEPSIWQNLPRLFQFVLRLNNTLIGRVVLGPAIGQVAFVHQDFKAITNGNLIVLLGWLKFIPSVSVVLIWLYAFGTVPIWQYAMACYFALSLLKIRTYIEHRAHELAQGRSVVVEDRGPLSVLFLNNNFHAVHHAHPTIPWYNLPAAFRAQKTKFLSQNGGYYFYSYWDVFKKYLWSEKDVVAHPFWNLQNRTRPLPQNLRRQVKK
jgi:fatty acid desaturase